jgi:hypothetical protein
MRFLQETHATHGGPTGEMLLFEVTVNGGTYTTEAIKSDLRRIWKQDVAGSRDAVFTFVDTTTGFVFRFALFYTCREFVTGSIAVRITAPR